jgi:hypothetical protein
MSDKYPMNSARPVRNLSTKFNGRRYNDRKGLICSKLVSAIM